MAPERDDKVGAVLVVGGGIAGIQASLDLAEAGYKVYLAERRPALGGNLAALSCKAVEDCNDCSVCEAIQKMVELSANPLVIVLTNADVVSIDGVPGRFEVLLQRTKEFQKREPSVCDGLPAYLTEDTWEGGELKVEVGAVILAPGFESVDPGGRTEYGYGRFQNVITAKDLEEMIRCQGSITTPSNHTEPKSVAFIQCVGSRDLGGNRYCSSVCCTYALKESIAVKQHIPSAEVTVFFIDMRTYEKGVERYYNRAEGEYGVTFVRSRVPGVSLNPEDGSLRVRYENEDGKMSTARFDLVVLSTGLGPPRGSAELAKSLGVDLNKHGFLKTTETDPLASSHPGIFVCGAFSAPKSIPETVAQATAAASASASLLSSARGSLVEKRETAPRIDISQKLPRIGVLLCESALNQEQEVEEVVQFTKALPDVVWVGHKPRACSPEVRRSVTKAIKGEAINRFVVASCSPRTQEPLFWGVLEEAGFTQHLLEVANLWAHCSSVHLDQPNEAIGKAKDLLAMAVAKARLTQPSEEFQVDMNPKALVIGGGLAGITAASAIAQQGFEVHLVERERELGGNLRELHYTLNGVDPQKLLRELIEGIKADERIHIYESTEIEGVSGYVGNFKTTLRKCKIPPHPPTETQDTDRKTHNAVEIEHGVVIVATGAKEYTPEEYLYGKDPRVITQRELERRLSNLNDQISNPNSENSKIGNWSLEIGNCIVIIQCVGSRDEGRPYCSRLCCSQAIKNALKIKSLNPGTDVYVIYRDIRTYGFKEDFYTKAREAGVLFVRYDLDNKPEVISNNGSLNVVLRDPILSERLLIPADLIVLGVPVVPDRESVDLSQKLSLSLDEDGFFLEDTDRLRPVEAARQGMFLCGLARSPKSIDEAITEAKAAALKAVTLLSRPKISPKAPAPVVDLDTCIGCGVCESLCAYQAIEVGETEKGKKAQVALIDCEGCGGCTAVCPEMANVPGNFTDEQLIAQISAVKERFGKPSEEFEPRIIGFVCNWCAYAGADLAGISKSQYRPNLRLVRVMCSGRIDPALIVEPFLRGMDGVAIFACHPGDCHYSVGSLYTRRRIQYLKAAMEKAGLEPERLHLDWVSAAEGYRFSRIVDDFTQLIKQLGPISQ